MATQETTKKDNWEKSAFIFKGLMGIIISSAIGWYGIKTQQNQVEIAEKNRHAQILIQTMNHRESSASQMRAQMFNTLMQHYFKEQNDTKEQIVILELIGLNFQDHLHLKPLFKRLDAQLKGNGEEREKLRKVAKQIKRIEFNKIVGQEDGMVIDLELESGNTYSLMEQLGIPATLKLTEVREDHIRVTTDPDEDKDGFEVTFFDMPFMDNSTLGEVTFSILLDKVDMENHKVKIKVAKLPKHFYGSQNNLQFDSLIGPMLDEAELN